MGINAYEINTTSCPSFSFPAYSEVSPRPRRRGRELTLLGVLAPLPGNDTGAAVVCSAAVVEVSWSFFPAEGFWGVAAGVEVVDGAAAGAACSGAAWAGGPPRDMLTSLGIGSPRNFFLNSIFFSVR